MVLAEGFFADFQGAFVEGSGFGILALIAVDALSCSGIVPHIGMVLSQLLFGLCDRIPCGLNSLFVRFGSGLDYFLRCFPSAVLSHKRDRKKQQMGTAIIAEGAITETPPF